MPEIIKRIAPRGVQGPVPIKQLGAKEDPFLTQLANMSGAVTEAARVGFNANTAALSIENATLKSKISEDRIRQAVQFSQGFQPTNDATEAGKQTYAVLSVQNGFKSGMDSLVSSAPVLAQGSEEAIVSAINAERVKAMQSLDPSIIKDENTDRLMLGMFEKGAIRVNNAVQAEKRKQLRIKQSNELVRSISNIRSTEDLDTLVNTGRGMQVTDRELETMLIQGMSAKLSSDPSFHNAFSEYVVPGIEGTLRARSKELNQAINKAITKSQDGVRAEIVTMSVNSERAYLAGTITLKEFQEDHNKRNKQFNNRYRSDSQLQLVLKKKIKDSAKAAEMDRLWNDIRVNFKHGGGGTPAGVGLNSEESANMSNRIIGAAFPDGIEDTSGASFNAFIFTGNALSRSMVKNQEMVDTLTHIVQSEPDSLENLDIKALEFYGDLWKELSPAYKGRYFADSKTNAILNKAEDFRKNRSYPQAIRLARQAVNKKFNAKPEEISDSVESIAKELKREDTQSLRLIEEFTVDALNAGFNNDDALFDQVSGLMNKRTFHSRDEGSIHLGDVNEISRSLNEKPEDVSFLIEQAKWQILSEAGIDTNLGKSSYFQFLDSSLSFRLILADGTQFGVFQTSEIKARALKGRDLYHNDPTFRSDLVNLGLTDKGRLWWDDTFGSRSESIEEKNFDSTPNVFVTEGNVKNPNDDHWSLNEDGTVGYGHIAPSSGVIHINGKILYIDDGDVGEIEALEILSRDLNKANDSNLKFYGSNYKNHSPRFKHWVASLEHAFRGRMHTSSMKKVILSFRSDNDAFEEEAVKAVREEFLRFKGASKEVDLRDQPLAFVKSGLEFIGSVFSDEEKLDLLTQNIY